MNALLARALHGWNGWTCLWVVLLFCAVAALAGASWYAAAGWLAVPEAEKAGFHAADFLFLLAAYGVLFLMLNIGATLAYVTVLGLALRAMGRYGLMTLLPFVKAWKLALLTGMVPLAVILVFGQVLQLPFGLALALMLVHGLWLRTIDLPEGP